MENSNIRTQVFDLISKASNSEIKENQYAILDLDETFLCKSALTKLTEASKALNSEEAKNTEDEGI